MKKWYGSKKNARKADFYIRKLNQWIKWYNSHLGWNQALMREVKNGVN
jgi:hypothetical protein